MIDLTATGSRGVTVDVDGRSLELSWRWLRDHALDDKSFMASAQQRIVTPEVVSQAGSGHAAVVDAGLEVSWPGGPTTVFESTFLGQLADAVDAARAGPSPEPWTGDETAALALRITHDDYVGTDAGLRLALDHLWRHGVIQLTDVPIDMAATRTVLERLGYIRSTIFGDMWEFRSDGGFDDTASTPLEITPHTDGTYSHDAPGLLGLHCHRYEAVGGENVFVDGITLAERLSEQSRRTLRDVDIPGRYIGDGAHLVAHRPALRFQGDRLEQISYNHHDRAPFVLPEPTMTELFDALRELDALANDPSLQIELAMRPGDMVIFDNWRLLHGRRAFEGERLIAGGYINREDFESTTRQSLHLEV